MQRQHTVPFLAGAALFAASAAAVLLLPDGEAADWRVAIIAVATGALGLIAVGALGYLSARAERRSRAAHAAARAAGYTDIEVRAMLRAMIATASSDGMVDAEEMTAIEAVFCAVTGEAFDPVLFERLVAETLSPGYAIRDDLKLKHSPISAEMRLRIVRSCARVMFADGSVQSAEVERLTALADLFGIDHADLQQIMRDEREEYVGRRGRA